MFVLLMDDYLETSSLKTAPLKRIYYGHFQSFIFHLGIQWSSFAQFIMQKLYRSPEKRSPVYSLLLLEAFGEAVQHHDEQAGSKSRA